MKVRIKKLNPNAVTPFKTYEKDFCYDCIATSCEEVAPNVYKYGLGFALEIERSINWKHTDISLSIDARPRSSIWKTGMILSNCEGTIDELYRGEISAVFYHVMPNMPRYKVGDKIVQIKIGITEPIEFEEVNELSETERGQGGFGSTDK
jgi:dUTP pyrophosphatase